MKVDQFLQYIRYERNLSVLTVKAYADDLRQLEDYLTKSGEDFDPQSVTQSDLRAWMVYLSETCKCGPRSVRRKMQAVSAFFKWLVKIGDVSSNPVADLEMAKLPKRLPQYVREASLNAILDSPDDGDSFVEARNRLIVMLIYEAGLRRAELISLRDADVDTVQSQLKVHGKRNKDRLIPFGAELREAIEHYRTLRSEVLKAGVGELIVTERGGTTYPSLIYKVVHDALAEAGVGGKKSPHVLRHSFASAMLNGGAEINAVKDLLGHESLAATQIYTHITFRDLKNNYQHAHPRALKKGG